jgi:hypothetical protein
VLVVQLRYETKLASEDYIRQEAWESASLESCPLHPKGRCGLRKLGYYDRAEPAGLRVARWYCPQGHRTFSLLPDFAAARVSSTLAEIEQVVERFEQRRRAEDTNNEGAAAIVRPDIDRASAVRYVNCRRRWAQAAFAIVIGLLPEIFAGCEPSLASLRSALGVGVPFVLVHLREIAAAHLHQLPAPLGFGPLPKAREINLRAHPHNSGPAPPRVIA